MVGLKPRRGRRLKDVSGQDHLAPKRLKTGQRLGVSGNDQRPARALRGQRRKAAARPCIGLK
jgi:hypothetical protein